jgi:hypothetical protein
MVLVPPFNFPLENRLVQKLDLMIKRCTTNNPKRDAVLLCEGAEGEGKTTESVAIGYYISYRTGRPFNHLNIFFDLRKMIDTLKSSEDMIAVWDEPALQSMSKDALSTIVKDLERLLMMARKKRHFIIINLAYFNKFSEYIVWQRPLGMIHVYSRNEITPGRFVYIRKKNLEKLWLDWKVKHTRNYRKYCSKGIRGTFADVMNPDYRHNVLSSFDINHYESEKDKAIMSIGSVKKKSAYKDKALTEIRYKVASACHNPQERKELSEKLGVSVSTIERWAKKEEEDDENGEIA